MVIESSPETVEASKRCSPRVRRYIDETRGPPTALVHNEKSQELYIQYAGSGSIDVVSGCSKSAYAALLGEFME